MNHRALREEVCMLALNELDERSRERARDHMRSCVECRTLHDAVSRMARALADAPPLVDRELLRADARADLMRTLRAESLRPRWSDRLADLLPAFSLSAPRVALGATLILVAGLLIGRMLPGTRGNSVPTLLPGTGTAAEPRITNIRFQRSTEGGDRYEVEYDEVIPVRIRGTLQDPAIQKALVHAMVGDENPGVRLRAVTTLGGPTSAEPDREIKTALILALRSDPNAGVRKQALTSLRRLPYDEEIKNAFIHTLMVDQNPGLRIDAINSLDSVAALNVAADRALLDVLRDKAARDENTYVRWKARAVLQEANIQ